MLELKRNKYEGKNKDELINKALNELNASIDEVYMSTKEEVSGSLFKSKKYILNVIVKQEVIQVVITILN